MNPASRSTAAERREHLLDAAMTEFAQLGYAGSSTERIAAAAGISQSYVFRLCGSKLELFVAALDRCHERAIDTFRNAAGDLRGEDALLAIGIAYRDQILADPRLLRLQMAGYSACHEPAVRNSMRDGFGELVQLVYSIGGDAADDERVARFFAKGMLLNILSSLGVMTDPTDWGMRLINGCDSRPTLGCEPG